MIAETPTVMADAPAPYHGEITERPIPVPSKRRMSVVAAAAAAPANMAAQETALFVTSSVPVTTATVDRAGLSNVDTIATP
jgi:hypothetical protein